MRLTVLLGVSTSRCLLMLLLGIRTLRALTTELTLSLEPWLLAVAIVGLWSVSTMVLMVLAMMVTAAKSARSLLWALATELWLLAWSHGSAKLLRSATAELRSLRSIAAMEVGRPILRSEAAEMPLGWALGSSPAPKIARTLAHAATEEGTTRPLLRPALAEILRSLLLHVSTEATPSSAEALRSLRHHAAMLELLRAWRALMLRPLMGLISATTVVARLRLTGPLLVMLLLPHHGMMLMPLAVGLSLLLRLVMLFTTTLRTGGLIVTPLAAMFLRWSFLFVRLTGIGRTALCQRRSSAEREHCRDGERLMLEMRIALHGGVLNCHRGR